jgi:hypothetical protein
MPGVGLPYAIYLGTISQMLRPFPQYSNVTSTYGNLGNSHYNSLQAVVRKTLSSGMTFMVNYTLAKAFDDITAVSGYVDSKSQDINPTHVVNGLAVYRLPFGKGQRLLSNTNRVLSAIVSNWQISGISTYRSGAGLGAFTASCTLPNAGTCNAAYNRSFSGPVRINGTYGSGNLSGSNTTAFLAVGAFANPAAYSYGDTPRTLAYGLRGPAFFNQNLSVRRDFSITEHARLTMQADSLNAFNGVSFSNPNTTITSTAFGKITSQANTPRDLQFSARISF